jgi:hypothetical protein
MDEYVDAALRMLERCVNAPRRALIGNWVHDLPTMPIPARTWTGTTRWSGSSTTG